MASKPLKAKRNAVYGVYLGRECVYVGMSKRLETRRRQHLKKYGDKITIKVFEWCDRLRTAARREKYWIKSLNPRDNQKAGGGGRPPLRDSQRRSNAVLIRLTEEEHEIICQKAALCGEPVSVFIRRIVEEEDNRQRRERIERRARKASRANA